MVTTNIYNDNFDDKQPVLPRGLTVLLTAASGVIVVAGMRAFSSSIGPLFLP